MAFERLHRMVDSIGDLPGLFQVRRALFTRRFGGQIGHAFHGVYPTFEEALAHAPRTLPSSYDTPEAAGMYVDRLEIEDYDYPALYWLQDALRRGSSSVADIGGSTGIKFYAFEPHLALPSDATWRVIETPSAVRLGREIAARRSAKRLEFSCDLRDADGLDILFCSGTLQYLPQSLGEILAAMRVPPRRVIVNTTPIHPSRSFFTLNNIGTACCPYRVTAFGEFVAAVTAHGYELAAKWQNVAKELNLPYHPQFSLRHYSGFCFVRAATAGGAPTASPGLGVAT